MNVDLCLLSCALDLDLGNTRMHEPLFHDLADLDILVQERRVIFLRKPPGIPCFYNPEPKPDRMNLLSYDASVNDNYAESISVIWLVLFLITFPRPIARALMRFMVTP
jgi:hypothetical protein